MRATSSSVEERVGVISQQIDRLLHPSLRTRWAIVLIGTAVFVSLAIRRLIPAMNPPSLYVDDVWVAMLLKGHFATDWIRVHAPTTLGYLLTAKVSLALFKDPEWSLQLVALLAFLAEIPLMAYLVWRVTGSSTLGLCTAAMLLVAPLQNDLAVRVKHYTVDSLASISILVSGVAWFERPTLNAFWKLVILSVVAFLFSSASVLVSGATICSFLACQVVRDRSKLDYVRYAIALLTYVLAVLVVSGWLMSAKSEALQAYWAAFFMPPGWTNAWAFLRRQGLDAITAALPGFVPPVVVLGGLVVGLVARRLRPVAIAVILIYVEFAVVSWLQIYPMGGGRTDVFLHPTTLLAASLLGVPLYQAAKRIAPAAFLVITVFLLGQEWRSTTAYADTSGSAQMFTDLGLTLKADDLLIVFPHTNWFLAYYGPWKYRLVVDRYMAHNVDGMVDRPRTFYLLPGYNGTPYWAKPEILTRNLEQFVKQYAPATVYFASVASNPDIETPVLRTLHELRYRPAQDYPYPKAHFVRLVHFDESQTSN
jgi:hypothetical protein